jgi:DNA replication protein DnaC
MSKPKNFFLLLGNSGRHKTLFCASLAEWMMSNFSSYRYFKEKDLLDRIKQSFDRPNASQVEVLNHLIDHDLVILDDVASGTISEWSKEMFYNFCDQRYNTELPTIITSNLLPYEFRQVYHPRICSRLFDAENTVIDVSGPDLRLSNE